MEDCRVCHKLCYGTDGIGRRQAAVQLWVSGFFNDPAVKKIDMKIGEQDWQDLRDNPKDKTRYQVSVTIDGETYERVVLSTKENSSLSKVAASESDRYSFKLNFKKLFSGRTFRGLDKMKLSNVFHDPSYLRDYLSSRIISEAGVDC